MFQQQRHSAGTAPIPCQRQSAGECVGFQTHPIQQERKTGHVPGYNQPPDGIPAMRAQEREIRRLRPVRQPLRIPQAQERQTQSRVRFQILCPAPEPIIFDDIQLSVPEAVVVGVARPLNGIVKVVGGGVLLIDLPVGRKHQTQGGFTLTQDANLYLPVQLHGEISYRPLISRRLRQFHPMDGTVRQDAVAPERLPVPQPQTL